MESDLLGFRSKLLHLLPSLKVPYVNDIPHNLLSHLTHYLSEFPLSLSLSRRTTLNTFIYKQIPD